MTCPRCGGCTCNRRRNPEIQAYHCGGKPPGEPFDFKYYGTGEGYRRPPNGPGFYFLTDKHGLWGAEIYCKYVHRKGKTPWLYTVRITTDRMMGCSKSIEAGIVDPQPGLSRKVGELVGEHLGLDPTQYRGLWGVHQLVTGLGAIEANRVLVGGGVDGFVETLNNGLVEIAVYNPDAIEVLDYEEGPITD